ncbi:MAG: nicotinate-nicotinamide nucleotide adenylyltransferase [Elusimicrobiota bacterium]|nr:nicotinate-nicotinamide nucleotide adenylyltransferase [Elusimicrobiota bacterium]
MTLKPYLLFLLIVQAATAAGAPGQPLKIGVYTGTFDPPHLGHKAVIEADKQTLGLDRVYVLPNPLTPHKKGALPYAHRRAMAELAFSGNSVEVASGKIEEAMRTGKVDGVLRTLEADYEKGTRFFRLMGDDTMLRSIQEGTLRTSPLLTLVVNRRGGDEGTGIKLPAKMGESPILVLDGDDRGISSTKIREAISAGKCPPLLSKSVWKYIQAQHLYGWKGKPKDCPSLSTAGL